MRQAIHFLDTHGLILAQTLIWEKPNQTFQKSPYRYCDSWEYLFVFVTGWPPAYTDIISRPPHPALQASSALAGITGKWGGTVTASRSQQAGNGNRRAAHTARTAVWRMPNGGNGLALRPGGEHIDPHSHPAIYPYTLAADLIRSYCPPGGLVVDPMAGSGTTLRAAVDLGRRAVGVEIVPEYAALIRQRMMQPVMLAPAPACGKVALPTWGDADRLAAMAAPAQSPAPAPAPAYPPDDTLTPAHTPAAGGRGRGRTRTRTRTGCTPPQSVARRRMRNGRRLMRPGGPL